MRKNLLAVGESSISLESQLERLALEANFLTNMIDMFKNIIPALKNKLSESSGLIKSATDKDEISEVVKECKYYVKELKPKFKYVSYVSYSKMLMPIPEGFVGTYKDYLITLNEMMSYIYTDINTTLSEYNAILASFISNKDDKISLKDHKSFFTKVKDRQSGMSKEIAKYFPNGNDKGRAYLNTVLQRFTDIDDIVELIDKLDRQHHKQNLASIINSVNNIVSMLDIIIENANSNSIDKVSGNAAMNISEGAHALALYVEFLSVYRFRTEQAVSVIKTALETLNTAIK